MVCVFSLTHVDATKVLFKEMCRAELLRCLSVCLPVCVRSCVRILLIVGAFFAFCDGQVLKGGQFGTDTRRQ